VLLDQEISMLTKEVMSETRIQLSMYGSQSEIMMNIHLLENENDLILNLKQFKKNSVISDDPSLVSPFCRS